MSLPISMSRRMISADAFATTVWSRNWNRMEHWFKAFHLYSNWMACFISPADYLRNVVRKEFSCGVHEGISHPSSFCCSFQQENKSTHVFFLPASLTSRHLRWVRIENVDDAFSMPPRNESLRKLKRDFARLWQKTSKNLFPASIRGQIQHRGRVKRFSVFARFIYHYSR